MKLLRTLAMTAALVGAAAEETLAPSPAPPSVTTATPAPDATTSSPTIITRTSDGTAVIRITAIAKFEIKDNVTSVSGNTVREGTQPRMRVELGDPASSFQIQELSSDVPENLEFDFVGSAAQPPTVELASFSDLPKLTSLSFSNIHFISPDVSIKAPPILSYLKIDNTNARNVELEILPEGVLSNLNKVEFSNNNFSQLPLLLYQRLYTPAPEIVGNLSFSSNVTELSKQEFDYAKLNLEGSTTVSFSNNCSTVASAVVRHVVCQTSKRTGIRTLTTDNLIEPTTSSPLMASTPTPTPTTKRDSANTTLTVIVVVISVVAAVLAFLVARRYFWSSSRSSRSPRLNERTVGLISKDESHAAQGKLSFISADDTLRPLRLEPQDVAITKSVGAGKLWIGDYQGRKVIVKRVEAESSDSYATKALISQAKSLATLAHPTIVSMVGVAWVQGTDFGVVAEFMEKGTLKAMLMDLDAELDLQSKLHLCLDVAQALLYLHSNERNMFVKRLSSRKVLVNNAVECKVNLFECYSCSSKVELPEVFGAGMLAWEAPEVVTRSGVLNPRKMNIFSLGVLICEVMTRVSPYQKEIDERGHTLADIELTKRIRRQEKLLPHENRREFTELPIAVRDLVERCLSYQPLLRPTAEEVVQILESAKGYSERFGSTTSL